MVGKGHLRVLETVDSRTARQDLANSLDYASGTLTNILGDLEGLNLIERERAGTRTVVRPTAASCVDVYHSLVKTNPHIDFPELLTGSALVLLYHLSDTPTTGATLIRRSGLSRATVYRHLKTLQNRALVLKDESRYRLADDFVELHTFAVELYHQLHRWRIAENIDGGVLIWETHDEFLVQTDETVDTEDYHLTGLAAFAEYGLMFITLPRQYHFYAPSRESLDALDYICHLLLIEDDIRNRQYALLLLATVDPSTEELHDRAEYYRMADVVDPLPEYLKSRGEVSTPRLPPWGEFKSLADDYEVEV